MLTKDSALYRLNVGNSKSIKSFPGLSTELEVDLNVNTHSQITNIDLNRQCKVF
jgi:hypothetical protein